METREHNLHCVMCIMQLIAHPAINFTADASGTGPIVIRPRHHGSTIRYSWLQ